MALIFDQKAPADVLDVVRKTLGSLAAVTDSRGGRSPLAGAILSDVPLPVYSLRLDALARGTAQGHLGLDDAEPESWRIFVIDNRKEPTGVADVAPAGGGGGARFLSYTEGPQAVSSGQILTDAEGAGPMGDRKFRPGFLEIPGINVSAVWLKALDGRPDAIIPVDPVPKFLAEHPSYTLDEFLVVVRSRAAQRLEFNNAPRRNGTDTALV
jgi:hypothetical protein